MIAYEINEKVLDNTINTAEELSKEKKEEDIIENRDISLIDYLSKQEESNEFISLRDLILQFKEFLKEEDEEVKYINSRWLGRALRRLGLIKERRRLGQGREVIVDYKKAREKIKIFKEIDIDLDNKINDELKNIGINVEEIKMRKE